MTATRLYLLISALFGVLGISALSHGAHVSGSMMTTAGEMLMLHAPVLMAAAMGRKLGFLSAREAQIGLAAIALGVVVFGADLALRSTAGFRLFPMATPLGGAIAVIGWMALGLAALRGRSLP
jgi:uncharacterized membrane protein YgdD (TMEM256/DUF423 family)